MTDAPGESLDLPPRLDLPLFAYGPLKPGEPAYEDRLDGRVRDASPATFTGVLRYREGLPLLDADTEGTVEGVVLSWAPGAAEDAYAAVSAYASRHEHRWLAAEAVVDGDPVAVNVLRGRRPKRGSSAEAYSSWSSTSEPAFAHALAAVRRVGRDEAAESFPQAEADDAVAWSRFYRLHAAYLLLWSALERFALLASGPATSAMARLDRLDDDPRFLACVVAAGVAPSPKGSDSADPWKRVKPDGAGAVYSWYGLRTAVGHARRSPSPDGALVRRALVELHDTFRLHLANRLPALTARWEALEPDGRAHQWLLRPVVSPDGLG